MERPRRRNTAILTGIFVWVIFVCGMNPSFAQTNKFRFIASGDTVDGGSNVVTICNQIRAMAVQPDVFILGGDIGPDSELKSNMGSLHGKTFPVRGNHDSGGATWTSAGLQAKVTAIGGKNYSTLSSMKGLVYSFDYKNAHFVGLDVPGDFAKYPPSSAQLDWLDKDLTDAENRGLAHAFIWSHPPLIANGKHGTSAPPKNIIAITNKHKIVSAWFGGHTHVFAWTHLNSKRSSGLTNEFESFNAGPMGDGGPTSLTGSYDAGVAGSYGFATIDVEGQAFTVTWYNKSDTRAKWSKTLINTYGGAGIKIGDINGDGQISSYDALLVTRYVAGHITLTSDQQSSADVNGDKQVTQADADLIAKYVVELISKF